MKRPMLCFKNPKTVFKVSLCFVLLLLAVVITASHSGDVSAAVSGAGCGGNSITALLRELLR